MRPFHNGYGGEAKCQTCCDPFPCRIHQTPIALSHSIRPAVAISVFSENGKALPGTGMPWNWAGFTKVKAMDCIPAQGSKCARLVAVTMVLQCCMLALHPFRSHHVALEQRKGLVAMLTNTSSLVDESAVLVDESGLDPSSLENGGVGTTPLPIAPSPVYWTAQHFHLDRLYRTLILIWRSRLLYVLSKWCSVSTSFVDFHLFGVCFVKWSKLPTATDPRIMKHWQFSGFWTNSTSAPNPPFGSIRIHRAQH